MNALMQFSHQSTLLAQLFLAALIMLGMGLEGLPADQDMQLLHRQDFPPV